MIGYITLGSNDIEKLSEFYDALFAKINTKRVYDNERFKAWATQKDQPFFAVVTPYNDEPATHGNGTMIGLLQKDITTVDLLYKTALELGGSSEGEPGLRSEGYYCAYVRDLDNNKLNFFCYGQAK